MGGIYSEKHKAAKRRLTNQVLKITDEIFPEREDADAFLEAEFSVSPYSIGLWRSGHRCPQMNILDLRAFRDQLKKQVPVKPKGTVMPGSIAGAERVTTTDIVTGEPRELRVAAAAGRVMANTAPTTREAPRAIRAMLPALTREELTDLSEEVAQTLATKIFSA